MEQFCKEQFWENAMKTLVRDILYRDKNEENRLRTDVYPYDIVKMAEDVKDFYKTVTDAGMEVSTSAMAGFLVYISGSRQITSALFLEKNADVICRLPLKWRRILSKYLYWSDRRRETKTKKQYHELFCSAFW